MDKKLLDIDRPILITGCARSGTSMVAGIINICGAFGGKMYGGSKYNRKGYFENMYIRREIQKEYMKSIGADPQGQYPLPDTNDMRVFEHFGGAIKETIQKEGYKRGLWFYKDATICLNWPVWHYAFPNAQWIIVRRPDEDIVESCMNTSFMSKYSDRDGWHGWVDHHKQCFSEMIRSGLSVKEVWTNDIVEHKDFHWVGRVITDLGLEWDEQKVKNFVDQKLWKTNRKEMA